MVGAALLAASVGAGALAIRPVDPVDWRPQLWELQPRLEAGRVVQPLVDGGRAQLTLDVALQADAERLLSAADAVHGAAVVVDVADGRVLALAGRSRATPGRNDLRLPLGAWAPAASVFKLVTTAALVEPASSRDARLLSRRRAHRWKTRICAQSAARWAVPDAGVWPGQVAERDHRAAGARPFDPRESSTTARALGFGAALPFALPTERVDGWRVPVERLPFARTAAGFWQTTLSPLHGALVGGDDGARRRDAADALGRACTSTAPATSSARRRRPSGA
jgi:peptidoglycan glycosyltransferase